jgi:hypothetical protein
MEGGDFATHPRLEQPTPQLHLATGAADADGLSLVVDSCPGVSGTTRRKPYGLTALVLVTTGVSVLAGVLSMALRVGGASETRMPGFVLSVGANGQAQTSAPDGRGVASSPAILPRAAAVGAVFAPDGHYLVSSSGVVMRLDGDAFVRTGVSVPLGGAQTVAGFADGDRAVVTIGSGSDASYPVYVRVFGQQPVNLGRADAVAGDPERAGAVVSIASSQATNQPSAGGQQAGLAFPLMDTRVEMRDVGRPKIVLERASQLDAALDLPSDSPIQIRIVPSPTGQRFALEVTPSYYSPPWEDLVIVNRHGDIEGTAEGLSSDVTWSRDGRALAYPVVNRGHLDITMWTIGARPLLKEGPRVDQKIVEYLGISCLWAPTGSAVLCVVHGKDTREEAPWLVASQRHTHLSTYAGQLFPLAWLSSPLPERG